MSCTCHFCIKYKRADAVLFKEFYLFTSSIAPLRLIQLLELSLSLFHCFSSKNIEYLAASLLQFNPTLRRARQRLWLIKVLLSQPRSTFSLPLQC